MSDDEGSIYMKNRKFTPEEDEKLKHLVLDEKLTNWVTIASRMEHRNVHQCRERWRIIGNKRGKRGEWSKAEDEIILSKSSEIGHHWSKIQKFVPNHTLAQVKARLKYLLKQTNSAYIPPKGMRKVNNINQTVMKTRHSAAQEKHYFEASEVESPPETAYNDISREHGKPIELLPQDNQSTNELGNIFSEFQDQNDYMGFTVWDPDNESMDNFLGC